MTEGIILIWMLYIIFSIMLLEFHNTTEIYDDVGKVRLPQGCHKSS